MAKPRKHYTAQQKAAIALTALKGQQTLNEIASDFGVHPVQVAQWKKQLVDEAAQVFATARDRQAADTESLLARLYQEIGQLKVEVDWLKKKSGQER
jgi:transposase-like protein